MLKKYIFHFIPVSFLNKLYFLYVFFKVLYRLLEQFPIFPIPIQKYQRDKSVFVDLSDQTLMLTIIA